MSEITTATYAGPDRRRGPDRRALGDDPTGRIDSLLFAKVAGAQSDAEARYLGACEVGGAETADIVRRAAFNAKAEGLAEAMSLLVGEDPATIRERSQGLVRERQRRERASIAEARGRLA